LADTFFDTIFENDFFSQIGSSFKNSFMRGQFYHIHFHYTLENLEYWRPKNYDDTETSVSDFEIVSSAPDAFSRRTPIL
jgi:hypothetical protein